MRLDRLHPAATDMEKELAHLVMFLLPNIDWSRSHGNVSTEAAQIIEIQIRVKMLETLGIDNYNYATSEEDDLEKRGR